MHLSKSLTCLSLLAILLSPLAVKALEFPPASDRGAPSRTAGGGTRGEDCIAEDAKPLTALMPTNNVGTTAKANPTFFFYVPKTTATQAEFAIVDREGADIYVSEFPIDGTPGVIALKVPETINLGEGNDRIWHFGLICNPDNRALDKFVQGFLYRETIEEPLRAKLERSPALEKAELYAKARIWHETLEIAAELRDSHPEQWQQLLSSVGLESIASEPLISCCEMNEF
ncbi:DUF928 domain-containing protein [Oxynema aestuarii]|uniref:DUF928 domain-containing protein n=1 Tax=Oxynema aestuarii AP17 TaxID=2064643 RepID=A0A6H1TWJ3_9CYAN|nr:DUF928 domain-containing protein [Oxynema aestuarii]QIZ70517.1 DUF928 domain-containing protein [Oxynema aestuarii AP17]RMH72585.1 MAG: DUF928 domain-containing protein [Cyanobacteria bacterium J007]